LNAIQYIKAAFFVRLHEALKKEGVYSVVTPQWIDVIYGGFVFRFDIFYPKEIHIARSKDPLLAEAKARTYVHMPTLHSHLHALQLKYVTFGLSARLAKHWIAHHLLAPYICDELVELLVASLYTNPQPFSVPHSHIQGFFRSSFIFTLTLSLCMM
jgi:U3 small nucleolar RNA-associated protein 22